jgi:CheY-like chemotaxis protein
MSEENARRRAVLLVSPRKVLGSSLRAVLEPHGYRLRQVSDPGALAASVLADPPDVVILDEEFAERALESIGSDSKFGVPTLPVLLYSASSWKRLDQPRRLGLDDATNPVWDVVEEPIRSHDLLTRLDRLLQLQAIWESSSQPESGGASGFAAVIEKLPILDSIASRSDADVGCVVLGPTRPGLRDAGSTRDDTLSGVEDEIRGSDLYAWMGPSELVVILYGADIDGAGRFVSRIARRGDPDGDERRLSAGIVSLAAHRHSRGGGRRQPGARARLRVLERVAAARGALERAREAGGGVRVGGTA